MTLIVVYLLVFLAGLIALLFRVLAGSLPDLLIEQQMPIICAIAGGVGGCVYCLRAVYLNACVNGVWDRKWLPWYLIRPFVSVICGGVAYLFLVAGLLVLQSQTNKDVAGIGFYALAFIAGLNVDGFISRIESLAKATWSIDKSRAGRLHDDDAK